MDNSKTDAASDSTLDPQKTNRAALDVLARVREIIDPNLSDELRARLAEASKRHGPVRRAAAKSLREYRATDAEMHWQNLSGRNNRLTLRLARRRGAEHEVVEAWVQERRVPLRAAAERLAAWVDANQDVLIGADVQLAHLTCTSWHEALIEMARHIDDALSAPRMSTDRAWKFNGLLLPWAASEKLERDLRREWARVSQRNSATPSTAPIDVADLSKKPARASVKHARGTLDERALVRAKQWQADNERKDSWTVAELAKDLGAHSASLIGEARGKPRCPLFKAFWNDVQTMRAEAKLGRTQATALPDVPRARRESC